MTRKEALDFLELADSATDQQARQRLADKILYYQEQAEHAPSAFLQNLNVRHLNKAKSIQKEFPEWNTQQPEMSVTFSDSDIEEPEIGSNELEYLTTPVIVSSANKLREGTQGKSATDIPGWLISYASDKPSQTYGLMPGNNYIGRKADPAYNPFIVINDDPYVSKVHAVVTVERKDVDTFYLSDPPVASRNGIFYNGGTERISGKIMLGDGDTIQVGATKFILRINKSEPAEASEKTSKNRFVHTIVLGKS